MRTISVTGALVIQRGFTRSTVVTAVKQSLNRYINNLGISGDVVRNEIVEKIMLIPGVEDVNLTAPSCGTPRTVMLDNELPRTADANLDIT